MNARSADIKRNGALPFGKVMIAEAHCPTRGVTPSSATAAVDRDLRYECRRRSGKGHSRFALARDRLELTQVAGAVRCGRACGDRESFARDAPQWLGLHVFIQSKYSAEVNEYRMKARLFRSFLARLGQTRQTAKAQRYARLAGISGGNGGEPSTGFFPE